jgi:hypothetical protein
MAAVIALGSGGTVNVDAGSWRVESASPVMGEVICVMQFG